MKSTRLPGQRLVPILLMSIGPVGPGAIPQRRLRLEAYPDQKAHFTVTFSIDEPVDRTGRGRLTADSCSSTR